ncbi:MAG: tRNA pseudouridine(38-40) synthase TruA [Gemmatimonadota bacterium]|nr:tRNA pseudouridine(38-40) synthase TruA [Gemmatimonadota bacterium]
MEAPDTTRFQLIVHYDGSAFRGWQFQPDQRTVQGDLQAALSTLADAPTTVIGSGRTDTGVHATGQVASVDMPARWTTAKLRKAMNATLPREIWVESVRRAALDFHPRYDAIARRYTYRVGLDEQAQSPFQRSQCWALGEALDRERLASAAERLLGRHSFEAFAKAGQPERGYECVVAAAVWTDWQLGVRFDITADRYLHHMVRYLVGTMVDIARHRRPATDLAALLTASGGLTTSPPAPPEGLFLAHVEYPESTLLADEPPASSPTRSTATT